MRMQSDLKSFLGLSAITIFILLVQAFFAVRAGIPLTPEGPTESLSLTIESLWERGQLGRPELAELYREAQRLSRETGPSGTVWQDRLSVGLDGDLYPKHAWVFCVVALPWFGLLGFAGLWALNAFSLTAIVGGIYWLAKETSSDRAALVIASSFLAGSQVLSMGYGLHYDLFAAACVVWSFVVVNSMPFLSGSLAALAVGLRVSNMLYAPFLLFLAFRAKHRGLAAGFALGGILTFLPIGVVNWVLWGAPLTGPYARLPEFHNGAAILSNDAHRFSLDILLSDLGHRLLSADGLIVWYPGLLFVSIALIRTMQSAQSSWAMRGRTAAAATQIVFFLGFSQWDGVGAPRFFLGAMAILWPSLAALRGLCTR